jgi:polysaccharide lyase-like protein
MIHQEVNLTISFIQKIWKNRDDVTLAPTDPRIDADELNRIEQGISDAVDGVNSNGVATPAYTGDWAPSTPYVTNQLVTSPATSVHMGALVSAVNDHTSTTTYNPVHWTPVPKRSPLRFNGRPYTGHSSNVAATDASLTGDFTYVGGIQAPDRIQIVANPSRHEGQLCYRFETRMGDTNGGNGATGDDRTEFTGASEGDIGGPFLFHDGDEAWMARSVMFPEGFPVPTGFFVFGQMFADDLAGHAGGSPPFAFEMSPNRQMTITVRGGVKALATDAAPFSTSGAIGWATPGVWHDILLHVKWSTSGAGILEVWHREAGAAWADVPEYSLTALTNILTVGGFVLPMYPEVGIYRASMAATQVYYDKGLQIFADRTSAEASFAGAVPQPDPRKRILWPASSKAWTTFDNFEDGSISSLITLSAAGVAVERGGEIQMKGTLDTGTFAFSKASWPTVALTGKRLITEIVHPGLGLGQGRSGIEWALSSTNFARFAVTGDYNTGSLFAETKESNSGFNSGVATVYDPFAHRFFSIREAAGVLYFETSPNCRDWTTFWSRTVGGGLTPASLGTPSLTYGWYNAGKVNTQVARYGMFAIEA